MSDAQMWTLMGALLGIIIVFGVSAYVVVHVEIAKFRDDRWPT